MADPLSIAASLVGIAAAAIATSQVLIRVGDTLFRARKKINDLAQALAHFSSVLRTIARVLQESHDALDEDGLRDADALMKDCKVIVDEITRVFEGLDADKLNILDRAKWLFREDGLRYPRAKLEMAKADLMLILEVLNLAVNLRKPSVSQVNHSHEVQVRYESAKVFVVVRQMAFDELQAVETIEQGEQHVQTEDVSNETCTRQEGALVRRTDVKVSQIFANMPAISSLTRVHGEDQDSDEDSMHSTAEPLTSNEVLETKARDTVRRLLLDWTVIENTSELPEEPEDDFEVEEMLDEPASPDPQRPGSPPSLRKISRSVKSAENHYYDDHQGYFMSFTGPKDESGVDPGPVTIYLLKAHSTKYEFFNKKVMLNFEFIPLESQDQDFIYSFAVPFADAKKWKKTSKQVPGASRLIRAGVSLILATLILDSMDQDGQYSEIVERTREQYVLVKDDVYQIWRRWRSKGEQGGRKYKRIKKLDWDREMAKDEFSPSEFWIEIRPVKRQYFKTYPVS